MRDDVLIIGGGIIGVSAAYYLARAGVAVTIIEKGDIAAGSS
ncbi:MAG: FAD-dependent oxidoreductase, partial [Anaerolineales bacterium]|nr:FAD-dependent oxidoreductase [Anaerolineales bacterium]